MVTNTTEDKPTSMNEQTIMPVTVTEDAGYGLELARREPTRRSALIYFPVSIDRSIDRLELISHAAGNLVPGLGVKHLNRDTCVIPRCGEMLPRGSLHGVSRGC